MRTKREDEKKNFPETDDDIIGDLKYNTNWKIYYRCIYIYKRVRKKDDPDFYLDEIHSRGII